MKKTLPFLTVIVGGAVLLGACEKGSHEYHMTNIDYPGYGVAEVYADQQVDSIKFVTFDDWSMSSTVSWARLSSDEDLTHGTVKPGYYLAMRVPVYFDVNNTDADRVAKIDIVAYGRTYSALFRQHFYHNVHRPFYVDSIKGFSTKMSGRGGEDSIVFTAYQPWKLTLDNDGDSEWIKIKGSSPLEGAPGHYAVYYNVTAAEDTTVARTANWKLEGAGVCTAIKIVSQSVKTK